MYTMSLQPEEKLNWLQHHLPEELPDARPEGGKSEIARDARSPDHMQNLLKAPPEEAQRDEE